MTWHHESPAKCWAQVAQPSQPDERWVKPDVNRLRSSRMSATIPVFEPSTGIHTLKAVTDALDVGWLGMGAFTKQFEDRDRRVPGTSGARGPGDQYRHVGAAPCTPGGGSRSAATKSLYRHSISWPTCRQLSRSVPSPSFVTSRPRTWASMLLAPTELITPRTKAIMPLHYGGVPCDLDGLYALALEWCYGSSRMRPTRLARPITVENWLVWRHRLLQLRSGEDHHLDRWRRGSLPNPRRADAAATVSIPWHRQGDDRTLQEPAGVGV